MNNIDYTILNFSDANKIIKTFIGTDISIFSQIDKIKNFHKICRIENYFDKDDLCLLNQIDMKAYLNGKVFIYTEDYSIDNKIIFEMNSSSIAFFVGQFYEKFHTTFFGDKTIFVCPETRKLLLYFEEGWWFYYDLPLILPEYFYTLSMP